MDFRSSLNQLLFSKSVPNYNIPYDTKGRKIYPCTECGDKFIFESSYEDHINRKVIHIVFQCKKCSREFIFKNRCQFLHHIRLHLSKSFTINYKDLSVQLLPVDDFPILASQIKFNTQRSTGRNISPQEYLQTELKLQPKFTSQAKAVTLLKYPIQPKAQTKPTISTQNKTQSKTPTTSLHAAFSATKDSSEKSTLQPFVNSDLTLPNNVLFGEQNDKSVSVPQTKQSGAVIKSKSLDRQARERNKHFKCEICREVIIDSTNPICTIRADHYRRSCNKIFKCPVCLFMLPNECAMETHIKLHLFVRPHICPECGKELQHHPSILKYPFSHDCEGFRMMRLSARVQCPLINCKPFHPEDFRSHMKNNHLKTFFKCLKCNAASPDRNIIYRHLTQNHSKKTNATILFQCLICEELFPYETIGTHIQKHASSTFVFPCWNCDKVYHKIMDLINHTKNCNNSPKNEGISNLTEKYNVKYYKVHKRCDSCKRIFVYKCRYSEIENLTNECPHCAPSAININLIVCPLCKESVRFEKNDIEEHFVLKHKELNIAARVMLEPCDNIINTDKKRKRIRNRSSKNNESKRRKIDKVKTTVENNFTIKCNQCEYSCLNKSDLQNHLVSQHRDPCAAYQCLECGQCFVVKRSFSTHLEVEHNISNVEDYINNKKCFNRDALKKTQEINLPKLVLHENQCEICLEKFDSKEDIDKHFRVHGMAYLLKKAKKSGLNTS